MFKRAISQGSRKVCLTSVGQQRYFSAQLINRIAELVPEKQDALKKLNAEHGDKVLGTCTVTQAIGGMRGVKSMLWETSLLDSGSSFVHFAVVLRCFLHAIRLKNTYVVLFLCRGGHSLPRSNYS